MVGLIGTIDRVTRVTFPQGGVRDDVTVLAALRLGDGWGVVTDHTPFHPVDHTWPDHPADHGVMLLGGARLPVVDCVIGAAEHSTGELLLGSDIPVRRGAEGWDWVVVHVVSGDLTGISPGTPVELVVDEERRRGLSAGHTACELVTLAINEAFADSWRKPVPTDVRGRPNFDNAALTVSRIHPNGSRDDYRLGKSLRRKGFVADDLAARLPEISARINALMTGWVNAGLPVWIDAPETTLTGRRTWNCQLPDGTVTVPCGGTHVGSTADLGTVAVGLELDAEASALSMHTTVTAR